MRGNSREILLVSLFHHLPLLGEGHTDVMFLLVLDVFVADIHSVSSKGVGKVSALPGKLPLVSQLVIAELIGALLQLPYKGRKVKGRATYEKQQVDMVSHPIDYKKLHLSILAEGYDIPLEDELDPWGQQSQSVLC